MKSNARPETGPEEKKIVALDLGDRQDEVCVLERRGGAPRRGKVANTREALGALSRRHPGALVVMEVGMHSFWVSWFSVRQRVDVISPVRFTPKSLGVKM